MKALPVPSPEAREKLAQAGNIWFASVRSDGRPHLTPVWFVYDGLRLYVSIDPNSIKSRNLASNPNVSLALEDGSHPLICEGRAELISPPYSPKIAALFQEKYDWDIRADDQYGQLVEITPRKWLAW
jgi:nitroimidazol reductase NimA-like FMN-containing flavoprotein (pyridoxamine 5'-phosphate oxidase superfamily)